MTGIWRRWLRGASLGLALVAGQVASAGEAQRLGVENTVRVGVFDGKARVDLNNRGSLVIVSSLARRPGPFSIQMATRSVSRAEQSPVLPPPRRVTPRAVAALAKPQPAASNSPPDVRPFSILTRDGDPSSPSNYTTVRGRLMALGRRVQIYVDPSDAPRIDRALLADLVATFDDRVYPLAATRFGAATDVDGDGRFTILLSSWLDRMAGGRAKVDGFVRGADLDLNLAAPFGNRCDMMYLNASLKAGPHAHTVLAHEYTHAVTFSRRALDHASSPTSGQEEEAWLDEALAHLVEDLHGFSKSNIDYRVSAYLSSPERYRLVVDDYYAADLFRSHGNRGGTYLFLRWLADREGDSLIDSLIRSDRKGLANIEMATGLPFAELYRDWTIALFLSGMEPGMAADKAGLYRSIDMRGMIEDWILAGPRVSRLNPRGKAAETWSMAGTSTHYAIVEGDDNRPTRVEINGPGDSDLQVTVVPLPYDLGSVDLSVRPIHRADGTVSVRISAQNRGERPVRLGAICWEPLRPSGASDSDRGMLDMLGIASTFGGSTLAPHGLKVSKTLNLGKAGQSSGPLVFKLVGTDARGRRIAAWAELRPEPSEDDEPLAGSIR